MVRIKISGIPVEMPFEPYTPQLVTIAKLIDSFQNDKHALIESPTGTGKSLSIICSVLAFYEHARKTFNETNKPFKIFICSRTHKQLDQLVEQLRKTIYRPRIAILGSKNQCCINPRLNNISDKNEACEKLLKLKQCSFFIKKDKLALNMGAKIFDIEELKTEGKKCGGCPYFASRKLQEDAEVIFAPYNYLIDTNVRESSDIKLENAILIIDEAHNIEDCCRAAGSLEITSRTLDFINTEVISAYKGSALLGEIKFEFSKILEFIKKLKEASNPEKYDLKNNDTKVIIRKGKQVVTELEKMGITMATFFALKNSLQMIYKLENSKELLSVNALRILQEIERVLGLVYTGSDAYAYCFTKSITDEEYTYNLWLLDPSLIFLPIIGKVKAMALLSGTLTPFNSYSCELKHSFENQIVAPHIMRNEQVFIANIKKGHLNQDLCGTYNITETPGYLDQICKIVVDIANAVKNEGGTLVFVSSYVLLNKLAAKIPGAIKEPKDGGMAEFERTMQYYKQKIENKQTAILVCVYRGKASEGIDFKDDFARAVIAIGIPYPSIKDPQIGLKKEYNDLNGGYNGRLWYETQAYRALNQALGRVIRHTKDWGAVFLLDSRYCDKRYQNGLPTWVSSRIQTFENFSKSTEPLKRFIEACKSDKNLGK